MADTVRLEHQIARFFSEARHKEQYSSPLRFAQLAMHSSTCVLEPSDLRQERKQQLQAPLLLTQLENTALSEQSAYQSEPGEPHANCPLEKTQRIMGSTLAVNSRAPSISCSIRFECVPATGLSARTDPCSLTECAGPGTQPASSSVLTNTQVLTFQESRGGRPRDSRLWNQRFEQLEAYRASFGHNNVPYRSQFMILAAWVKNQRAVSSVVDSLLYGTLIQFILKMYKGGRMASDRVQKLNSVGFSWRLKKRY